MMLLFILRETLSIANLGGYSTETRKALFNEIVNQQSGTIIELDEKKEDDTPKSKTKRRRRLVQLEQRPSDSQEQYSYGTD